MRLLTTMLIILLNASNFTYSGIAVWTCYYAAFAPIQTLAINFAFICMLLYFYSLKLTDSYELSFSIIEEIINIFYEVRQ